MIITKVTIRMSTCNVPGNKDAEGRMLPFFTNRKLNKKGVSEY